MCSWVALLWVSSVLPQTRAWTPVDDYERIRIEMQTFFNHLAIETPLAA
jgi:hypothetical protein